MSDISNQDVAIITIASVILRFMNQHRVGPEAMLVRISADLLVDIVGEEEYKRRASIGAKNVIFETSVLVDPELASGYCAVGWKQ